jgi:plastocyanin
MTFPPTSDLAVQTVGLGKRFGSRAALDGVDLEVPRGVAFGFLGANGAGKTTLIRLLLGLANPTTGTMRLLGRELPAGRAGALARVGAATAKGTAKEKGGKLVIPADPGGSTAYVFANAQATAGKVDFESPNDSSQQHDIAVTGNGVNGKGPVVSNGGVSRFSVTLKPGKYTFYCTVDAHRAAGMEGTLTVK